MTVKFLKDGQFQGECKPYLFTFPDGQPHISLSIFKPDVKGFDYNTVEVHCSLRNPRDLFNLGLVLDVIRANSDTPIKEYNSISVYIYWLFGARMDRRIDNTQPNTSDIVVKTLQMYSDVYGVNYKILDIHNPEIVKCRDKNLMEFGAIPIWGIFGKVYSDFYSSIVNNSDNLEKIPSFPDIYFPDKGAKERYTSNGELNSMNVLFGKKKRDPETGKLSGFEFESGEKKSDSIIIFDDAADGCGTFLGHLEILKSMGYKHIALYTTHGIYSKGMGVLSEFAAVYSTNSFILGEDTDEDGYPKDNCLVVRRWNRESQDWAVI